MRDYNRIQSPHLMQRVQEMQRFHQMPTSPSPPAVNAAMPAIPADPATPTMKTEAKICYHCEESITDRFVIDVGGYPWHAACLRCCVCTMALGEQQTCFLRRNKIYCKEDYFKACIARCAKCCREISPSDWVRKAKDAVYHLACFSCDTCDRQLSTGEQFAMLSEQILCREHYMETMEIETGSSDDSVGSSEKKSKRVRTAFTEEQLEVLNRSFELDNNPDGQDLERIAVSAGLSKRVTQVWFQNSRARQKKHSYQHKRNRPSPYDMNVQMQPNMVY